MTAWQNRVEKLDFVPAHQLLAHPMNARRHPAAQRDALRGSLDTLGWTAPVLVNSRTGFLLDGHARVEEALAKNDAAEIPVVYVSLDEAEEAQFLASFDWITTLAEYDRDALDGLLQDVQTHNPDVQAMLSEMAEMQQLHVPDEFPAYDEGVADDVEYITCPHCGEQFPK